MKFHYKDNVKAVSGFYNGMEGYVIDRDERAIVKQGGSVGPYYDYVEWFRVQFITDGRAPWIKGSELEFRIGPTA